MKKMKSSVWMLVVLLSGSYVCGQDNERRLLYVAQPGIRNYVEFGGHGILVFDIEASHQCRA